MSVARRARLLLSQVEAAARLQGRPGFLWFATRDFSAAGGEEAAPKPGEIGEVSGIPAEQLHRKVGNYT